jgi:hypothetical protein
MNIYEKLSNIQNELKAPKGQYNSFGNYSYRSCEDILEAVKPICKEHKTVLVTSDGMVNLGNRYYIEATATLYDLESEQKISNSAYARESETKKGMDDSQITGACSSYARKYALNGLFSIDDNKENDPDTQNKQETKKQKSNITEDQAEIMKTQTISKEREEGLIKCIKDSEISDEILIQVLSEFGYGSTSDILVGELPKVWNKLIKIKKEGK